MQKPIISRRDFARNLASAALSVPYFVPARALAAPGRVGANDRVHVGVIGVGVRGKYLISNLPDAARVIALCDCSLSRIGSALEPSGAFTKPLANFRERDARACTIEQDYRRLLDNDKLDAVVISAPDHHHVLAAILACQAGLDVYCEKPLSLTIAEGRHLVDAAKRHQRVLQVGSQQRTMEINRFACEFIRKGGLGKVSHVELPNYPGPMPLGALPEERAPSDLAWDLFCGPTKLVPHNRRLWVKEEFEVDGLLWRGWDLWRSYSGHLMTNWGGHSVDMAQFALGKDTTGPVEIWPDTKQLDPTFATSWSEKTPPIGTLPDKTGDAMRFCPVTMRYADGTELRFHLKRAVYSIYHGEKGKLFMSRNRFHTEPRDLIRNPPDRSLARRWQGVGHVAGPHVSNWIDCIKTRQPPNAPVEAGHRTATVCHLANIARELRRPLVWNPVDERFVDDDHANGLLDRPRRKGFELPLPV